MLTGFDISLFLTLITGVIPLILLIVSVLQSNNKAQTRWLAVSLAIVTALAIIFSVKPKTLAFLIIGIIAISVEQVLIILLPRRIKKLERRLEVIQEQFSRAEYDKDKEQELIGDLLELLQKNNQRNLPIEQVTGYLLDRMLVNVFLNMHPDQLRICVVHPLKNGRFSILGSWNIHHQRIIQFQNEMSWSSYSAQQDDQSSLFTWGLYMPPTWPYEKKKSQDPSHRNLPDPKGYNGYNPSKAHLIIPLRSKKNIHHDLCYVRCPAILTIGSQNEKIFENDSEIYKSLKPQIEGLREVLDLYFTVP
jgi:hypothetical protein